MGSMSKRIRRNVTRNDFDPQPEPVEGGSGTRFVIPGGEINFPDMAPVAGETFDEALARHVRTVERRK